MSALCSAQLPRTQLKCGITRSSLLAFGTQGRRIVACAKNNQKNEGVYFEYEAVDPNAGNEIASLQEEEMEQFGWAQRSREKKKEVQERHRDIDRKVFGATANDSRKRGKRDGRVTAPIAASEGPLLPSYSPVETLAMRKHRMSQAQAAKETHTQHPPAAAPGAPPALPRPSLPTSPTTGAQRAAAGPASPGPAKDAGAPRGRLPSPPAAGKAAPAAAPAAAAASTTAVPSSSVSARASPVSPGAAQRSAGQQNASRAASSSSSSSSSGGGASGAAASAAAAAPATPEAQYSLAAAGGKVAAAGAAGASGSTTSTSGGSDRRQRLLQRMKGSGGSSSSGAVTGSAAAIAAAVGAAAAAGAAAATAIGRESEAQQGDASSAVREVNREEAAPRDQAAAEASLTAAAVNAAAGAAEAEAEAEQAAVEGGQEGVAVSADLLQQLPSLASQLPAASDLSPEVRPLRDFLEAVLDPASPDVRQATAGDAADMLQRDLQETKEFKEWMRQAFGAASGAAGTGASEAAQEAGAEGVAMGADEAEEMSKVLEAMGLTDEEGLSPELLEEIGKYVFGSEQGGAGSGSGSNNVASGQEKIAQRKIAAGTGAGGGAMASEDMDADAYGDGAVATALNMVSELRGLMAQMDADDAPSGAGGGGEGEAGAAGEDMTDEEVLAALKASDPELYELLKDVPEFDKLDLDLGLDDFGAELMSLGGMEGAAAAAAAQEEADAGRRRREEADREDDEEDAGGAEGLGGEREMAGLLRSMRSLGLDIPGNVEDAVDAIGRTKRASRSLAAPVGGSSSSSNAAKANTAPAAASSFRRQTNDDDDYEDEEEVEDGEDGPLSLEDLSLGDFLEALDEDEELDPRVRMQAQHALQGMFNHPADELAAKGSRGSAGGQGGRGGEGKKGKKGKEGKEGASVVMPSDSSPRGTTGMVRDALGPDDPDGGAAPPPMLPKPSRPPRISR